MIPTIDLTLDASHRYWMGARELLSVTTALRLADLVDAEWFTEASQLRGTYVHEACCLIDDEDFGCVDPALAGYVAGYEAFLREAKPEWAFIEHRVCDPALGYAGTLDRVGFLNGKWVLVDLKTGGDAPWHQVQTAAYARLMPQPSGVKPDRFALYLRPDGTYRLTPFTDRADEPTFLAALRIAQFKVTHGYRS